MAVFYSFHYEGDYARAQQILQMGAIEGQRILNAQEWESVKRSGKRAIENWIDDQMKYKSAVVVLVGTHTASREWVNYEIRKAWNDRRPLVGIRIHGLKDLSQRTARPGANPFAGFRLDNGASLANRVPLHTPNGSDSRAVHRSIRLNLARWVASAVKR